MNPVQAAFGLFVVSYAADRAERHEEAQKKHAAWKDRCEENIARWENSLRRLEHTRAKISDNLDSNRERLNRAASARERLIDGASLSWLERQRDIASSHLSEAARNTAAGKVEDYETRLTAKDSLIARCESWIVDGEGSMSSVDQKISSLQKKINDVKAKLWQAW